jgi:hypothetical protein
VFSRDEWARLVRKREAEHSACHRQEGRQEEVSSSLPRYGEAAVLVRSSDGVREDNSLQTLAVVEKTTTLRVLGVPVVAVTRKSRWTDESDNERGKQNR